jgi:hypothetical protein
MTREQNCISSRRGGFRARQGRQILAGLWMIVAVSASASGQSQIGKGSSAARAKQHYETAATIQPSFSWTTGTQNQTIYGGSALLSSARSGSFCDPEMRQFGIAASASDTKTAKSAVAGGGAPTYIYSNDVRLYALRGLDGDKQKDGSSSQRKQPDNSLPWTPHFVAVDGDLFENNSLGIGLQSTLAIQYQYDLGCKLNRAKADAPTRFFASFGLGAGYMNQRLYKTVGRVNGAVLPLSAQFSYLIGGDEPKPGEKKGPPKLIWSASLGFVPVLNQTDAYQVSGIMSIQIPTQIHWLTISLSDSDLYANNAPVGHKRNYNNGSISLVFSFPPKPKTPPKETGACYGGDKLQRIYCYEGVTIDACTGTNIFRENQRCSSAGIVTLKNQ